jgi:SagB-type dehydrogenase family enzyme
MQENICQKFLQATYLKNCQNTKKSQALPPPAKRPLFADAVLIALPEPELLPDKQINFLELIELRSSVRQYSTAYMTLKELSCLLWCTQGVKMGLPGGSTIRNVPSAGACHAFETYLYIQRVEGLRPGLYRFLAPEHALVFLDTADNAEKSLLAGFKAANMIKDSAVTFIWTARLEAMAYAFGNRAYRYLFIEAGHVCQNLYLSAYTLHLGVCAIGGFYDEELNAALGIDGQDEFAVYAATVGKI